MRVILANSEPGFRGGEHQTVALAKGLLDAGLDVHAAVARGSRLEAELSGSIEVHPLAFESVPIVTPIRLRGMISSLGADILHAQTSRSHTHLWLARMLLDDPPPLVVSRRVAFKPRGGLKYRSGIAHYIPISLAAARGLSSVGVPDQEMTVIPSGIDVRSFHGSSGDERLIEGWGFGPGRTLIGTVAALEREKGLMTLIAAAHKIIMQRDGCDFLVVGEGRLERELADEIERRQITDRMKIRPQTAPLQDIMPLFDIYILPSLAEGLSTALIAAAATGLPIVASGVGGIPEIIGDDGGLLVLPGDAGELSSAVTRLLDDASLRGEISAKAARRADAFDIERTVQATAEVYRRVIAT
jgi:glycosyltransferase involved in cell wall biosynthesis